MARNLVRTATSASRNASLGNAPETNERVGPADALAEIELPSIADDGLGTHLDAIA